MRTYLSTIHQRSEAHKKRFALVVSGGVTMIIFSIWTLVNFGHGGVLAQNDQQPTTDNRQQDKTSEVSPLESIGASVSESFNSLKRAWSDLKTGMDELGDFDLNESYEEMKDRTINTYGGGQ
jgi:hypothetical protein